VPVALIGTFAVMLAMGFSANTISLLALVLAIGIVVDDAIVVVEAVEHILEHEPDLTVAQATEKAMTQVTGPIIAITLVLLSVFIPTAFIPGIAGQLYSQFAVAVSVAMVISAINALSLSPALCSLILRHAEAAGVMAGCKRIDKTDGVRLVTPSPQRHRPVAGRRLRRGDRWHRQPGPERLPARRGPGRLHGRTAAARRRLDQPHARVGRGSREDHRRPAVAAEHVHGQRLQPDRRPRPS
jgi:multidrug efflux pump subunit AcrB